MNALIILSALGIFALCSEIFRLRKILFPVVLIGILAALVLNFQEWDQSRSYFGSMMRTDNFALTLSGMLLAITTLWFLVSRAAIKRSGHYEEHFALILFALAGAVVMVSFTDMVMLFLGIEILSVSMYILAGSRKDELSSNEAALKYFILGAFSTGFLLFGIALVYGVTASFNLEKIAVHVIGMQGHLPGMLLVGVLLILASLSFKLAAFPFHFWAPDVYEGSPDIIAAFMGTVVKVAAIGAFYRLFSISFASMIPDWSTTLCVIAASSIIIGNVIAIFQNNLKRMFAYSGISHAGYMLLAILTLNSYSSHALLFYSLAYSLATFVAFAVLIQVAEVSGSADINSFKGLGKRNPVAALAMSIAMLSLAGIPPTAGFFGKYFLFTAALENNHPFLVLIAVVGTLVSIYYYFRVIHAMYLSEGKEEPVRIAAGPMIAIVISSFLILLFGIFPDAFLHWLGK